MKTYCIQETNLSNGTRAIITRDFRDEFKVREILAHKCMLCILDKAEITEQGKKYFSYRTTQGIEIMLAVIENQKGTSKTKY